MYHVQQNVLYGLSPGRHNQKMVLGTSPADIQVFLPLLEVRFHGE